MLLTDTMRPFEFIGVPSQTHISSGSMADHHQSYSSTSAVSRRPRHARSMSTSTSSTSSSGNLRLPDVAKQHCMAVHVENWREDMLPVRQYLPMQHIIGSLKLDHNAQVRPRKTSQKAVDLASPSSEDSFVQLLWTPKRRRTSEDSHVSSLYPSYTTSTELDPDRRFNYQAAEHVAKEIPRAALPGLNHALNLSTITANERDILSEYAPRDLEDPQVLMNEVLQLRACMTEEGDDDLRDDDASSAISDHTAIVPPERDAEVRKAFEAFIDLNSDRRFIAKI